MKTGGINHTTKATAPPPSMAICTAFARCIALKDVLGTFNFGFGIIRTLVALAFVALLMTNCTPPPKNLISHRVEAPSDLDLKKIKKTLSQRQELSLPLDQEFALLEQLTTFDLGKFLLTNKGLNGYWTAYIILHGPKKPHLQPLEEWILHKSPVVRATQERFQIFRKVLQSYLEDGITLVSLPCGLMDDLLGLDFGKTQDVRLVGIDLDPASLSLAQKNAQDRGIANASFKSEDAWAIEEQGVYDVISSNGLNIYEPDAARVVGLYKKFFQALKPDGVLVTSFLTPPPSISADSTWREFNVADLRQQKAIFGDIIGVSWQSFRTEKETRAQLEEAGFQIVDVIYDSQGMFPTIVAKKPQIPTH